MNIDVVPHHAHDHPVNIMSSAKILAILLLGIMFSENGLCQQKESYRLPSGPEGPGVFGAHYTHLKYDPDWDKNWRVAGHPDVVVRFEDGGHKFVFWRGTSYIPCWVTDNGIWYTNEFVERRGIHSDNTEGCIEPMSDKQCRYSHVRIIENSDARVVVHWRYAPIDVHYEHPFVDQQTGWSDWVDEYYVIYPDATGVRAITVHSGGLQKWTEFQEAIVVNQPGTLPDDNIERGAVSMANMRGEHITYFWDENGGPAFDKNPRNANMFTVNLKSERKPFTLVPPPPYDYNMITSYRGHGRNSIFNWWDHWPVSQDASDGRGATSTERPSHSSLCHIGLQKDPPLDCWGSQGYETVIRDGMLEWTTTQWSGLNLELGQTVHMNEPVLIAFDYADLWTTDMAISIFDTRGGVTEILQLSDFEEELSLMEKELSHFEKKINVPEIAGDANLSEISEVYLEISGGKEKRTFRLDNIRIGSYLLDFNIPDGSSIEQINNNRHAGWEPYAEGKDFRTKLMLHGMTGKEVQDLVPLAKSWTNPANMSIEGNAFDFKGYDPAQMAYVIDKQISHAPFLALSIEASEDSPLVNPALIIRNWGDQEMELSINNVKMKKDKDYRVGFLERLEGTDMVLWIKMNSTDTTSISIL